MGISRDGRGWGRVDGSHGVPWRGWRESGSRNERGEGWMAGGEEISEGKTGTGNRGLRERGG